MARCSLWAINLNEYHELCDAPLFSHFSPTVCVDFNIYKGQGVIQGFSSPPSPHVAHGGILAKLLFSRCTLHVKRHEIWFAVN